MALSINHKIKGFQPFAILLLGKSIVFASRRLQKRANCSSTRTLGIGKICRSVGLGTCIVDFALLTAKQEAMSPEVSAALRVIDEALPKWQNLNEQLMALRANNYNVAATIDWKRAEVAAGGQEGSITVADSVIIASLEKALKAKGAKVILLT